MAGGRADGSADQKNDFSDAKKLIVGWPPFSLSLFLYFDFPSFCCFQDWASYQDQYVRQLIGLVLMDEVLPSIPMFERHGVLSPGLSAAIPPFPVCGSVAAGADGRQADGRVDFFGEREREREGDWGAGKEEGRGGWEA